MNMRNGSNQNLEDKVWSWAAVALILAIIGGYFVWLGYMTYQKNTMPPWFSAIVRGTR